MKKISETPEYEIFLDYFQGQQVRISKSKATEECFFNTDDVARVLGYKDHNDMMQDPKVQAKLIEQQIKTGKSAIRETNSTNHLN